MAQTSSVSESRGPARQEDIVIRRGGDDFLVLLVNDAAKYASALARRLTDASPASAKWSIGWAMRAGKETINETMSRADATLYANRCARRVQP